MQRTTGMTLIEAVQETAYPLTGAAVEYDPLMDRVGDARFERAIGVIYRPETERNSHYFQARLSDQFDAVLHFDETRAVEPLDYSAEWEAGELPETFPFAV